MATDDSVWNSTERYTILVVDDSDDLRALIRFVLESMGHKVLEAQNGRRGYEIAVRDRPDLILMDLVMPELDGFGSTRAIKSDDSMKELPVIALSSHDSRDHRMKANAVGFCDFLTKPINFPEFAQMLKKWLTFGIDQQSIVG